MPLAFLSPPSKPERPHLPLSMIAGRCDTPSLQTYRPFAAVSRKPRVSLPVRNVGPSYGRCEIVLKNWNSRPPLTTGASNAARMSSGVTDVGSYSTTAVRVLA